MPLTRVFGALALLTAAASVPEFLTTLPPDALTLKNGSPVKSAGEWREKRRPEILADFEQYVYGATPATHPSINMHLDSVENNALEGKATVKQVSIRVGTPSDNTTFHLQYLLPVHPSGRVPTFVGLSFKPNDTVASSSQWQAAKIIEHGYGLATVFYGEIEPDKAGAEAQGVRKQLCPNGGWCALGAWGWGLRRVVDYLETDPDCDAKHIGLIGHSRLGKTALWAAAQDERFALVISNESGVGGASLYRNKDGETIAHLNTAFPHWFIQAFHAYTGHQDEVPVDGNLLLSLIAPRPLYVASAELDKYSDPPAEFYSAALASRVYELLGKQGLGTDQMPPLNSPIMHTVGYHIRPGKHDVTAYDWEQYLRFADLHFRHR